VDAWVFLKGLETLPLRMRAHITLPASTTHSRISTDERKAAGIGDELVRVAVGLDPAADIIPGLARRLDQIG
jgi:O-succinylhomoserine sulfhydrylase